MKGSIFSRVFSYRQRDSHTPLENFLTEIFAYCLEADAKFRHDFLTNILQIEYNANNFSISTQEEYYGFGRPDIQITFDNSIILIECKVESGERENQLNDYEQILNKLKPNQLNKNIVFLTKYFEVKELRNETVHLHMARWFQIYELINKDNSQVTIQLKEFLKEQGMEKVKNFSIQDLMAMKTIPETMTKMDELLEQFKIEFEKKFGGFSKDSSRSTRLVENEYTNYVVLSYEKKKYILSVGFFWWRKENEVPMVGLSINIPKKRFENSELLKILQKELIIKHRWEFEEDKSYFNYSSFKPLTDFLTAAEDNIPAMKKFMMKQLETLYQLKASNTKLLRK